MPASGRWPYTRIDTQDTSSARRAYPLAHAGVKLPARAAQARGGFSSIGHMTDVDHIETPTAVLAARLVALRRAPTPPAAVRLAGQCMLDWLGVTLAARHDPLARILVETVAGDGNCTLLGLGRRTRIDDAVLINGAMGHALDFDDVIAVMGHPTAPVAPVVFALAEELGASGAETVAAFIAGVEAECAVGAFMGPSHYAAGWHGTATYGAFGAAAAAAHLLRLDEFALRHALGLAGTQAAGLKSVFGTMSKPLHAGKAAANGLLAARLAARGFTSDTDILGSSQGFAATQSTTADATKLQSRATPYITDVLFKYHAACYLTHNTIEAAHLLRTEGALTPTAIKAITVEVQPMHMGVCNIEAPRTGLECKFSLRMTSAMALCGVDTFDERVFDDALASREDLVALCRRTTVTPTATGAAAIVTATLSDGTAISRAADVGVPERDLDAQQARLERKFRHIVRDALNDGATDQVIETCRTLATVPEVRTLLRLCAGV